MSINSFSPSTMSKSTESLSSISGMIGMKTKIWKIPWNGRDPILNQFLESNSDNPNHSEGPNKKLHAANPKHDMKNKNFLDECSQVYGSKIHPIRYVNAGILMTYPAYSSVRPFYLSSRTMNTL